MSVSSNKPFKCSYVRPPGPGEDPRGALFKLARNVLRSNWTGARLKIETFKRPSGGVSPALGPAMSHKHGLFFFVKAMLENRDVNQSKEHPRTMLTTREHNPSSHPPQRVLCRRQLLAARAPTTCSRTTLLLYMPKFSSISDSRRAPLGFGLTPEHSALWPTPKERTNWEASFDQRPPTSSEKLARPPSPTSSGWVLPSVPWLFWRASPPTIAPLRETVPSARSAETKVVHRQSGPVEELQTVHHHFQNAGRRDGSGLGGGRVPAHRRSSSPFPLPLGKPLRQLTPIQTQPPVAHAAR